MADTQMSLVEINDLTASAIRKVATRGQRGVEKVTHDEIVALVGTVIRLSADALDISQKEDPSND